MKSFVMCFVLLVKVIFMGSQQVNAKNSTLYGRVKRQDDRWSWGVVDVADPNRNNDQETTTVEPNPCTTTPSPVVDFRAPGRRMTQVKCLEYIWDIKLREDIEKQDDACTNYKLKHNGPNGPQFEIGGRDVLPGEFPHMFANGILPVDVNIQRIIIHPNYKPPKKYFDIALVELKNNVQFTSYVQPACLYTEPEDVLIGKKATLTGWGVIETVGRTTSPELQAAVVDVLDSSTCDELLEPHCNRHWCGMEPHQLCAGKLEGGVDACQGDSGGPIQLKISLPNSNGTMHHIIGVTSFGIGCALPNLPGIYTRVSSFLDWIEEVVWK